MFVVGCADDYVKGADENVVAVESSNECLEYFFAMIGEILGINIW